MCGPPRISNASSCFARGSPLIQAELTARAISPGFSARLANGANPLLTAPRRVGKTSLVLRLCELEREAGRSAVFMNVEGCHDELAFAERLVDGLSGSGLHPHHGAKSAALQMKMAMPHRTPQKPKPSVKARVWKTRSGAAIWRQRPIQRP